MPQSGPVVGIIGMAALRRDINRMVDEVQGPLYRAIRQAGKEAVEPVAEKTRGVIPRSGRGSEDRKHLTDDVRTSGNKTGGVVRMGRASVPWAGWVEFGGSRPDGSERDFRPSGRYLFPSAYLLKDVAATKYSQALAEVFASAGVWTNTSTDGGEIHD
jgi:hypothetical protein